MVLPIWPQCVNLTESSHNSSIQCPRFRATRSLLYVASNVGQKQTSMSRGGKVGEWNSNGGVAVFFIVSLPCQYAQRRVSPAEGRRRQNATSWTRPTRGHLRWTGREFFVRPLIAENGVFTSPQRGQKIGIVIAMKGSVIQFECRSLCWYNIRPRCERFMTDNEPHLYIQHTTELPTISKHRLSHCSGTKVPSHVCEIRDISINFQGPLLKYVPNICEF